MPLLTTTSGTLGGAPLVVGSSGAPDDAPLIFTFGAPRVSLLGVPLVSILGALVL
jgi:hypothetical protein